MEKVTCIVVDDEMLARAQLTSVIAGESRLEVIGQADRLEKCVEMIDSLMPDLVFLDIRMPGGGGFEILQEVQHKPLVVFVTAYDSYAVKAFDISATDYLLKPVSSDRLRATVDRVIAKLSHGRHAINEDSVVPLGNTGRYVSLSDLLYIRSEDKYTIAVVEGGGEYQVRQPLRTWFAELPKGSFLKIERSLLINARRIATAEVTSLGGILKLGTTGVVLTLGRRAAKRLSDFLDRKRNS